jgi:hypothetical protein
MATGSITIAVDELLIHMLSSAVDSRNAPINREGAAPIRVIVRNPISLWSPER